MSKKEDREFISIKEACRITGFAAQTFYNSICAGKLNRYGKPTDVRLDKQEVLEKFIFVDLGKNGGKKTKHKAS